MIPPPLLHALRAYVRHSPGLLGKPWLAGQLSDYLKQHPLTATARTHDGAVYPVVTGDVIQRYLWLFGVWEPHLTAWMSSRLAPGDLVVDAGAHTGYFTLLASRLVGPTGRVVAIEPSPAFHQALTANITANGRGNVRTINAAVSDAPGRLTFYLERATNLDGTTAARLIKIDVEGGGAAAVRGLTPALNGLRDDAELVVEVTPRTLAKQGRSVDDVLGPLLDHGFHTYRLANDYAAASYPAALRRPAPPVRWRGPRTPPQISNR
ncbi:FkbM family methyltransferase, partial [Streptomyces mirabilis]|uniref:FkbM family methyltransferase n=1 Tax=Streptomyces mirabilis TaxID=68239 RepID=UPI00366308CA